MRYIIENVDEIYRSIWHPDQRIEKLSDDEVAERLGYEGPNKKASVHWIRKKVLEKAREGKPIVLRSVMRLKQAGVDVKTRPYVNRTEAKRGMFYGAGIEQDTEEDIDSAEPVHI